MSQAFDRHASRAEVPEPRPVVRRRVVVSGFVQGVFFRETCRRTATRHGVNGWVRNCDDGTVEAVFEGAPDAVAALVEWARHGPPGAEVKDVEIHPEHPRGEDGFDVRL